jgi:hypothetical protein
MEKKMKTVVAILGFIFLVNLLSGCGDATMEPSNESYEQRIVIEGYLHAGQPIDRIYVSRNFPVDADLTKMSVLPDPDETFVYITDLDSDKNYQLEYNTSEDDDWNNYYWTYRDSDVIVEYGKSYQIDVSTVIDGKECHASSVTTVPEEGFEIMSINYNRLKYREKDSNENLKNFEVEINRSIGSNFYTASLEALNPTLESFIYDNPYDEKKPEDVDLHDDAFTYSVLHHAPEIEGKSIKTLGWEVFNFYDQYRVIIYAADENYKDYLITHNNVMEMNGNFHEPKFNFEGDGIGVFASIIADTVYVEVAR